ncbi:MAG: hypothetical protein CTY20_15660 [Hyphomicrobium sp.]|nr:MAG: hypothetical protein CTY20_15660 [Hyphomicrobium sp.]
MIRKTYWNDNPEDRRYVLDYWSWLQDQPQDAWLLWARCANWDNADTILEIMVDRPDCDIALVSWLFWKSGPATYIENPDYYRPSALIRKIVENAERGLYRSSALYYDRYEVAMAAHQYIKALRATTAAHAPFKLPRVLCGPFNGRRAVLPARYDDQTEQDLQQIFDHMNGGLPRSEDDHTRSMQSGGDLWLKDYASLPKVPKDPISAYRQMDDAAYLEAIFGAESRYRAALARLQSGAAPRHSWWPFG